ncbi:MAG: hypothetical protein D6732_04070 [Methanobacteriota archaeon]|nr:MAG: hypothetical protein D6732_04070 [Euryarchaeota archaeon]
MQNNDLDLVIRRIVSNSNCLRLCLVSKPLNFYTTGVIGTLTFLIEKVISEFELSRQLVKKQRLDELLQDDLVNLSREGWGHSISPRPPPNYIIAYFFEDFRIETFKSVQDRIFFYPLIADYSIAPEFEVISRIDALDRYLQQSGIQNPYIVLIFPERMNGYVPEFHVFYERLLVRLTSLPFPSLVVSNVPNPKSSLFGYPYSVIFKNMGVKEISFFMV